MIGLSPGTELAREGVVLVDWHADYHCKCIPFVVAETLAATDPVSYGWRSCAYSRSAFGATEESERHYDRAGGAKAREDAAPAGDAPSLFVARS